MVKISALRDTIKWVKMEAKSDTLPTLGSYFDQQFKKARQDAMPPSILVFSWLRFPEVQTALCLSWPKSWLLSTQVCFHVKQTKTKLEHFILSVSDSEQLWRKSKESTRKRFQKLCRSVWTTRVWNTASFTSRRAGRSCTTTTHRKKADLVAAWRNTKAHFSITFEAISIISRL